MGSIPGLIDQELGLLNYQIQDIRNPKRFELPLANNSLFINMTQLHPAKMQSDKNLITFTFDGLFNNFEGIQAHSHYIGKG
tara:strand:- start:206 stop:448 length:243 start_codon:yes stop_codon:yes gene_type:complete